MFCTVSKYGQLCWMDLRDYIMMMMRPYTVEKGHEELIM